MHKIKAQPVRLVPGVVVVVVSWFAELAHYQEVLYSIPATIELFLENLPL